jgi:hypothetical protein
MLVRVQPGIPMKSIEKLADDFGKEYGSKIKAADNHLSYGYGKDSKTGAWTIEARLTNDNGKEILPVNYHGLKVNIRVTGVIKAL